MEPSKVESSNRDPAGASLESWVSKLSLEAKLDSALTLIFSMSAQLATQSEMLSDMRLQLRRLEERQQNEPPAIMNENDQENDDQEETLPLPVQSTTDLLFTTVQGLPRCFVPARILREQGASVSDLAHAGYSEEQLSIAFPREEARAAVLRASGATANIAKAANCSAQVSHRLRDIATGLGRPRPHLSFRPTS